MLHRAWNDKTVNLVDPWTLFGKDSRIIPLFNRILSSAEIVSVAGGVPSVAENIFGALMLLAQEGNSPVKIIINSPGGSVQAGFTIIQGMKHLRAKGIEVWTINLGSSGSMAGVILAMGTPGRRYVLDDATTHAHEVQVHGMEGRGTDVEEAQRHLKHMRNSLDRIFAQHTKIPEYYIKLMEIEPNETKLKDPEFRQKLVREFVKQERLLSVEEALEAGMADVVIMPGDPILDEIFQKVPVKEGSR